VVFSSGLVNIVKNYVKKGSKLYVEGQLQTRKWTDNAGIEKYSTEIILQNFNSTLQMLDSNRGSGSSGSFDNSSSYSQNNSKPSSAGSSSKASSNFNEELDDDIPF
jgi:single-strand DNA-binding protein